MSQVDHYDLQHSVNWLNLDHTRRSLETALSEIALLDYGITFFFKCLQSASS